MIIDGYVRVSQVKGRGGDSFISPSLQREQIEGWAKSCRVQVASVFEELDESGARADRPMLMSALRRVEDGLTDGIVVAKLDRFGRSLLDSLAAIERIRVAGGTFVAVQDGLDMRTDTGKLVLRIMLSMAEWELDRVRSQWNTARERAVARGVHTGRCAPTGYLRPADRRLVPNPQVAPIIAAMFRQRADGASLGALANFLTEQGAPTQGARWTKGTVRGLINNRVYLGELHNGAYINRAAHEPIVDHVLWEAAQRPRVVGSRLQERKPTLLGGLMRCASCRMVMGSRTVVNARGVTQRVYTCKGESTEGNCDARAWISGRVVEPYLDAMFFELAHLANSRLKAHSNVQELTAELEHASADTARYRDSPAILKALGPDRFAVGLTKRVDREQRLRLAIDAERARLLAGRGRTADEWEAEWPSMSVLERRQAMSEMIDSVFIARGRGRADERILVCARGDGPLDLPSRGRLGKNPLRPFDPTAHRLVVPLGTQDYPPWSETRIREALTQFLASRKTRDWPPDDEFVHEGRGPLLRQVDLTGGPPRWAREPGIDAKPRVLKHRYWTDTRMRMALTVILKGRTRWPSKTEFTKLGYAGLCSAMTWRGEGEWAAEFGLDYRHGVRGLRWTPESIRSALDGLTAGCASYPTQTEFAAEGLGGLYEAISTRHGGHDRWAAELGLPRCRGLRCVTASA